MSGTTWDKLVLWLGKHMEALTKKSCEQVQQRIINCGDKLYWTAAFDGFYFIQLGVITSIIIWQHFMITPLIRFAGLHTEPREVRCKLARNIRWG